ncbi:hypothetical protein MTR67_043735 [Solanum verrucosum]|uniref:Uncharacterized protein n=1 Tax=Solanum verrucosum TaxID=315347 RepID=A0AAF0UPL8_SOLVR|nr:hypothetical protein MTR67_043735 [Solanum verrucosum]
MPKMDQGSLPAKSIGERLKDGTRKVDHAPVLRMPNAYYLVLEANRYKLTPGVSLPAQEPKHSARRPGLGASFAFEILLFHIGKVIVGLVLAKVTLDYGYLFADDLTGVVNQFHSPPSSEGWFSQPPTLTPPPDNSGLELIPSARIEGDGPAPGSKGEKLKKLHAIVEGHLRRYCASEDGLKRFPCLKDKNKEDF